MNPYPTRYSELSNAEVNELYRSETWDELSRDERLDALQELENRSAEELGNRPCEVKLEPMDGYQYGGYSNGEITLNEHLVTNGEFVTEHLDGSVEREAIADVNAQMMDTIHHENFHAYQDDVVSGRLEHSNAEDAELWSANWSNDEYIEPDDPSGCYGIQSLERSASEHGQAQTKAAFEEIEAKYGEDAGYQEYLKSIESDSYENALNHAQTISGDENIQETIDNDMLANYRASQSESYSSDSSLARGSDVESDSNSLQTSNDLGDSL
jgi:hypothetical protein